MNQHRSPVVRQNDQPAETAPWGTIQWLCNGELFEEAETTFGVVCVYPGQKCPEHLHSNCEALMYVLSGECEQRIGKAWYHLDPGSLIRIPRGVPHQTVNLGLDPCRLVCVQASPRREFEESQPAQG